MYGRHFDETDMLTSKVCNSKFPIYLKICYKFCRNEKKKQYRHFERQQFNNFFIRIKILPSFIFQKKFRRKFYYTKNATDTLAQRSATLERINKHKFATKNNLKKKIPNSQ